MNGKVVALILTAYMLVTVYGSGKKEPKSYKKFLINEIIDQCEGKDAHNFTGTKAFVSDQDCDLLSIDFNRKAPDDDTLTACLPTGEKKVTQLKTLAQSVLPAGAFWETQQLALALNGVLEGKYILRKSIIQRIEYLKECSSVLGQQLVQSKTRQMLISEKLDLNCLISPNGCWEIFKRGCTTQCHGRLYVVQSNANVRAANES